MENGGKSIKSKKNKKGKSNRKNKFISTIGICTFYVICFFVGNFLGKSSKNNSISFSELFSRYIWGIVFLYISLVLHVLIHEGGHLIFGLLTKYKFISFRIFNFIIIKEDGKFKLKRFKIKDTGGQCLLDPPNKVNGVIPYKLYNLGGILMNFVFSTITLIIILTLNLNPYLKLFLYIFTVLGYFLVLTNGIPMKMQGIPNDGYNQFFIGKDKDAINSFYVMLKFNALTSNGLRAKDLPLDLFELPEDVDLSNTFNASIKINEASVYDDKHDFRKARAILERLLSEDIKLISYYENYIKILLAFYEIMDKNDIEVIEELYDKDAKKFLKSARGTLSFKRFEYAYALIVENNEEKAKKVYDKFKKICKSHPNKSELIGETEIMELINERYLAITALN